MQTELQFQVADDEEQQKIDGSVFPQFDALKKKNLTFLRQFYPDLFRQVSGRKFGESSIFINRQGQLNIVELRTGEALYPLNCFNAQRAHAQKSAKAFYTPGKQTPFKNELLSHREIILGEVKCRTAESSDTLICLGLGGGLAAEELALNSSYKNLIVLEPSWDYFLASLYCVDWLEVNRALNNKGGMLAFDIEQASSVVESVSAVFSELSVPHADIYVHLHYPEYDAFNQAAMSGYQGFKLKEAVVQLTEGYSRHYHESPLFCHSFSTEFEPGNGVYEEVEKLKRTFESNLAAFEGLFPDIANAMKYYRPQHWLLTVNRNGDCNLYNPERRTFWYSNSINEDIKAALEKFQESPVETVPSTNLRGGKLSHYTFYQYSQKIAEVMNQFGKTRDTAPEEIPSLILISLGLGKAHEEILNQYNVDYLYVIEPNLDFFFWSMHCMDWSKILSTFADTNKNLNFSLGDDGSHFIDDMKASMRQFNGFFLLNSFLFVERQQKALAPYIVEFREDLMNLITLSEHFHYAHYALSHTYENFSSKQTLMCSNQLDEGSLSKNIPVFVVGNGPSIDETIGHLREIQEQVVIVSCGTVLRSLWKNGITPDFHAEVEQNKCTYSIISQIPDSSYLKQINYLAPPDTHPDTAKLFKRHYAMLTSLDGSMLFLNYLAGKIGAELQLPVFPFPTVSNFALSSLLKIGFENIVLIGVDLGFKDVRYHHSKDSLYYKEGKEQTVPSYEETMGGKIMVRGNFETFVYTKPEFKISAKNLGKSIQASKALVRNCSDGAKIEGAVPIKVRDIVFPSVKNKKELLSSALNEVFSQKVTDQLFYELDVLYSKEEMGECFDSLIRSFDGIDGSFNSIRSVIQTQKSLLLRAYRAGNILFYGLFVSTINFAHATLLKVALSQKDDDAQIKIVKEVRVMLVEMLEECFKEYQKAPLKLEETVDTELVTP
ncbi:6-hydroxymethylpterin diphosphokinase MptE-like protein [Idiomarina sp.]|uniref:6-hydroxymethylpterin diphosphokinase MptE-like protein n=1 Tax=Idiomarina sp. TaxID=1874361 RepID=UPI002603126A|nr:6-hydroxymethylpterin diphosphokinase MptE-like protein [Idiomarina sp.]